MYVRIDLLFSHTTNLCAAISPPQFPPNSVRPVAVEANPNQNFQSRLVFVYTKLLIVEMEDEYDRVVFLDADTLVLENIDELFECEPFCAVMRHSELLNSGVIVITPSRELYSHMHELIGELDSYTGG